jgi:RNA polymerase-binding transcription factor DksA
MALHRRDLIRLARTLEDRAEALRAEIRRDVARSRDETYAEIAGPTHDSGDEALASLVADLGNADLARDVDELRGLEAARRRIADGNYGVCADCGGDIPVERLHANPAAARCAGCQARHEKTYRR